MRPLTPIRILIVDDHELMLDALSTLLSGPVAEFQLQVIGRASNGADAIRLSLDMEPDLILMDLLMPLMKGSDAAIEIRRRRPSCRILILTASDSPQEVNLARSSGVDGYLLKRMNREHLVHAIVQVMRGERLFEDVPVYHDLQQHNLTRREQQVLKLLVEGKRTRDIGELLHLSPRTVEKYRANLSHKLASPSPSEMMRVAEALGLLS